jgi:hypothetical protein
VSLGKICNGKLRAMGGGPQPVTALQVAEAHQWIDIHSPEMGWMPLSPDGIAMCQTRGVEAQVEGEGIHGRS